jgi:hypothetical protein
VSALAGLATLVFTAWFVRTIPESGCVGPPVPGVTSLLAYQLATTPADVERVFGADGDPCRAGMVDVLRRANTVDLFGFIPTYGIFLGAFLIALAREGGRRAGSIGLMLLIAGLACDVLETSTQLRIARALPGDAASLTALAIGSRGKFGLLAAVSLYAGVAVAARRGVMSRVVGVGCVAGAAVTIAGLFAAPALLTMGTGVAWLLMFVYAVTQSLR